MLSIPLHGTSCVTCGLPVECLRISVQVEKNGRCYVYNFNAPCGCVMNMDRVLDVDPSKLTLQSTA